MLKEILESKSNALDYKFISDYGRKYTNEINVKE